MSKSNGWWVTTTDATRKPARYDAVASKGLKAVKRRREKQTLFFCEECSYVWQPSRFPHRQQRYEGLPSYGLERKECFKCKEK
tara:strand:- start:705 stop:953 length:249 start_codon:yes stop_codon:yes gene_type:complete